MNRTNVRTKGARNMDEERVRQLLTLYRQLTPEEQLTYLERLRASLPELNTQALPADAPAKAGGTNQ